MLSLLVSLILAVAACVFYVCQLKAETILRHQVAVMQAAPAALAKTQVTAPRSEPAEDLPRFNSSELVQQISDIAADLKLPVDEIGYVLDDSAREPYLRYRVTLRLSSAYPSIRTFSEKLAGGLSNVSLDALNCTRQDVSTAPLTCDLAFSAFYRKSPHG